MRIRFRCPSMLGLLFAAFVVSGCTAPAPPPVPPSAGEPSVEEITGAFRQVLYPITSLLVTTPGVVGWGENGRGAPALMTDDMKTSMLQGVKQVKEKYGSGGNYAQAVTTVDDELEKAVAESESQVRWRVMMALIETYDVLNPGSVKMARLRERAQIQLNRPEVVLKGFFVDKDKSDTYAFFHVILHPSNEDKRIQARKGEEFCGLRFIDIIGKRRGAVLEYLAVPGQTFRVMGP